MNKASEFISKSRIGLKDSTTVPVSVGWDYDGEGSPRLLILFSDNSIAYIGTAPLEAMWPYPPDGPGAQPGSSGTAP
jgi:hypothetical protein